MRLSLFFCFCALVLTMSLSSCGSVCGNDKKAFLDNYSAFVEEISTKSNKGEIAETDWEGYDKTFDQFTNKCYEKYVEELTASEKLNFAATTGAYLYSKHGAALLLKLGNQTEAVRKVLAEVDPQLLLKVAMKIVENPEELTNILNDLDKRYGN